MADWAGITQAAGPTIVGIGALVFARAQLRRGARQETQMADRAELRAVLDEAAQALRLADAHGAAVEQQLMYLGSNIREADDAVANYRRAARAVDINHDRLSIRLGATHRLVRSHEAAAAAVHSIAAAVREASTSEGVGAARDTWARAKDSRKQIAQARQEFMAEARALGGVELGRTGPVLRRPSLRVERRPQPRAETDRRAA